MPEKRNALAELAERLKHWKNFQGIGSQGFTDTELAQRIVAELAKPDRVDGRIACEIIMKCRAIAEEGAGDAS